MWKIKNQYDMFMNDMLDKQFKTLDMAQIELEFTSISEGIKDILMKE